VSYAVARVASGYGLDPRTVTGWDWLDVLIWGAALEEVERVAAIEHYADAVNAAALQAQAFHEPKQLQDAWGGVRRLALLPVRPTPDQVQEATEAVLDRVALAERIARRKARRGETDPMLRLIRGD